MRLAILGAGPGGYVAAIKAAQLGAEVTVIEDAEVGGTCLNWGCIPTKAMVASAEAYRKAKDLDRFGIDLKGEVTPNLPKILDRKNRIVGTLVKGIRGLFKNRGVSIREGRGRLTANREITVDCRDGKTETISADRIIIATGSRSTEVPLFPFDGKHIISSTDALRLQEIPGRLLIVGAGFIGCEFACIFSELGSEVTIAEMLPRALATEDHDISAQLQKELRKKKIGLITGAQVVSAEVRDDGVHSIFGDRREIVSDKVLVSVGRTPNSNDIGLGELGIDTGDRGEIVVNDRMETSVPGIYAVGDVTGGMLLAHVASAEGVVAAHNIMEINDRIDYSVVPSAVFTSPEIASVGIREHEADERGIPVNTGHFTFRSLGKAHAMGEIEGFIKLIAERATDRLIGAHIIGPHAADLIHETTLAIRYGMKAGDIAKTIHAHPTLAEGILEAAEDVHGEAVHVPGR